MEDLNSHTHQRESAVTIAQLFQRPHHVSLTSPHHGSGWISGCGLSDSRITSERGDLKGVRHSLCLQNLQFLSALLGFLSVSSQPSLYLMQFCGSVSHILAAARRGFHQKCSWSGVEETFENLSVGAKPVVYLDEDVVVLHQQRVVVDLAEELSRHHFVRAVLDETCDVQVTYQENTGRDNNSQTHSLCSG